MGNQYHNYNGTKKTSKQRKWNDDEYRKQEPIEAEKISLVLNLGYRGDGSIPQSLLRNIFPIFSNESLHLVYHCKILIDNEPNFCPYF